MKANKHLLLWSSLASLVLLGWAAWDENVRQEWRVLQREYRSALPPEQADTFAVRLRQVVSPALDAADRCVTCHVGMAPGEAPVPGHGTFDAHPDVVHDPAGFGCTVCHGGQGRATVKADAHGDVLHWPDPMVPARYAWAGCGSCHTHLAVPNLALLERGRALFERHDCLACHSLDGRGGTLRPGGAGGMEGPDLSRVGETGYDEAWHEDHLTRVRSGEAIWTGLFAPVPENHRRAIAEYLSSRAGAPGLVESKALFHSLGCRGCHAIAGVGGDDGPDLTSAGRIDPGQRDFSHVPERSVAAWHAEHLRAPARVVPGSLMPALGLTPEQIDGLTFYLMSLRRDEYVEAFWPKDRIRAERFGEREFANDGATLYGTFCAACHGPQGQGMRYPGMAAFPAIGNPDFLALVTDAFLRESIRRGRPGRRMPAWGASESGLEPGEIDALVVHLRSFADVRPEPDPRPRRWVAADAEAGATLYRANCGPCHGEAGEGREGTALNNRVFLDTATDTYMVETIRRGRRGTSMPAFADPSPTRSALSDGEIESIVAHIRTWEDRS